MSYLELARSNMERTRTRAWRTVFDRTSDQWGNLQIEFIKDKTPELFQLIVQSQAKLDQVWIDCRNGKVSHEDFEKALGEWEAAHVHVIEMMNGIQIKSIDPMQSDVFVEKNSMVFGMDPMQSIKVNDNQ